MGSCSNLGAAQARRLRIRINGKDGKQDFAHTLNNTVVAPPRMLIAFLENNLQADGTVRIPEALRPYMGGMNQTPASERVHIGFFGKRNAGKSSVMNKVTGQNLAVVSDVKGTTTDPVYKAMELLPLGPVVMMDTPGIDDEGELGSLRVKKSYQVLNKTDASVLVIDGKTGMSQENHALLELIKKKEIASILVLYKRDMLEPEEVCQTMAGLP